MSQFWEQRTSRSAEPDMRTRSLVFRAIEFAAKAHSGQCRKGTQIPYIIHPLNVAKILIENQCEDRIVVAGLLHDTLEDTDVTYADIRKHFGEEIARLVAAASEPDKSDMWENRKQQTIDHLKEASVDALVVECADKLDNIRAIAEDYAKLGESVWTRFARPKESQSWYYRSLAEAFTARAAECPCPQLIEQFQDEVRKVFGESQ